MQVLGDLPEAIRGPNQHLFVTTDTPLGADTRLFYDSQAQPP